MQMQIAFLAVIVAPLTEELFFRGILYRTLKSLLGAGPAILVTSLAFGLAHLNLLAFGPLFALSVFLIISYEKTGNLAVPILYHAMFNLLMVISIIFGNPVS
jgi:membrane protease YdiL (CAAX protease family)